MNKQINLVINGKGGVGKSFFATNFAQYLKDCGIAHCAIDSDHENSTLKRSPREAKFDNLEQPREIDRMFTTAETCDLLVIDCRAASTDLFIDFFGEVGLERGPAHSRRAVERPLPRESRGRQRGAGPRTRDHDGRLL